MAKYKGPPKSSVKKPPKSNVNTLNPRRPKYSAPKLHTLPHIKDLKPLVFHLLGDKLASLYWRFLSLYIRGKRSHDELDITIRELFNGDVSFHNFVMAVILKTTVSNMETGNYAVVPEQLPEKCVQQIANAESKEVDAFQLELVEYLWNQGVYTGFTTVDNFRTELVAKQYPNADPSLLPQPTPLIPPLAPLPADVKPPSPPKSKKPPMPIKDGRLMDQFVPTPLPRCTVSLLAVRNRVIKRLEETFIEDHVTTVSKPAVQALAWCVDNMIKTLIADSYRTLPPRSLFDPLPCPPSRSFPEGTFLTKDLVKDPDAKLDGLGFKPVVKAKNKANDQFVVLEDMGDSYKVIEDVKCEDMEIES